MRIIRGAGYIIKQYERGIVEFLGRYNHFVGNAKDPKGLEVTENSLKDNAKIIVTEKGISPQLILGDLPVSADVKPAVGRNAEAGKA